MYFISICQNSWIRHVVRWKSNLYLKSIHKVIYLKRNVIKNNLQCGKIAMKESIPAFLCSLFKIRTNMSLPSKTYFYNFSVYHMIKFCQTLEEQRACHRKHYVTLLLLKLWVLQPSTSNTIAQEEERQSFTVQKSNTS